MVFTCRNRDYGRGDWVTLRDHSEVLSWHLSLAARAKKIETENATVLQIFEAQPARAGKVSYLENVAYVGISAQDQRDLRNLAAGTETFQVIMDMARRGILLSAAEITPEIGNLLDDLKTFEELGYERTEILVVRRPRGLGITLQVDARMNHRALRVDFVALRDGHEIFRDTMLRERPSRFHLSKRFKKIMVDDGVVWVPGAINRPDDESETYALNPRDRDGKLRRRERYEWSVPLSRITASK